MVSSTDRLVKLGIPYLKYCQMRADVIQVHMILSNIDKIDKEKFFIMSEHTTSRGNDLKFFKRRFRFNASANAFSNRVENVWTS